MVINPTTTVKLFSGVPLDNTYSDTLYFSTLAEQTIYFSSLTPVKTFTSQMYQRVNAGIFEANCKADDIYNCNYMAFQNSGFGNKWFYAFIKNVEYVNNNNARVTFEIDVMQTYMFDCTLEQCFIERQHSLTDGIGDNILPESVECGEYVFDDYEKLDTRFDKYAIVIVEVNVDSTATNSGEIYDSVFSGGTLRAIYADPDNLDGVIASIQEELTSFIQKPEAIVNMYMCPLVFLPFRNAPTAEDAYSQVAYVPSGTTNKRIGFNKPTIASYSSFGNYIPKNKKLFTYPYNFYHVDNGDGSALALRYEFFSFGSPQFLIDCCLTSPVQMKLVPLNYKGVDSVAFGENRAEFLTISNFPLCSWNNDTYRAWIAQNSIPTDIQGTFAGAGVALALATKGMSGLVAAGAAGVAKAINIVTQSYQASIAADVCHGNINSGNVNFASHLQTFFGGRCRITEDYARMIDDFFTMYGYSYNKIGVPNISSRPHWNYVKTNGAKIVGNCPSDDIKKMCEIYDNGVTFWKNASEVGNYSLDNSPA